MQRLVRDEATQDDLHVIVACMDLIHNQQFTPQFGLPDCGVGGPQGADPVWELINLREPR
jgi:hypothetical protein